MVGHCEEFKTLMIFSQRKTIWVKMMLVTFWEQIQSLGNSIPDISHIYCPPISHKPSTFNYKGKELIMESLGREICLERFSHENPVLLKMASAVTNNLLLYMVTICKRALLKLYSLEKIPFCIITFVLKIP